jgi:hypothetical protein
MNMSAKKTDKKTTIEKKPATDKKAAIKSVKTVAKGSTDKLAATPKAQPIEVVKKIGTDKLYRIIARRGDQLRLQRVDAKGNPHGHEFSDPAARYAGIDEAAPTSDAAAAPHTAATPPEAPVSASPTPAEPVMATAATPAATTPTAGAAGAFRHDPRVPEIGNLIRKVYKSKGQPDRELLVTVEPDGFTFEGKRWRSLSGIAAHVTGGSVNGFLFFGLDGAGTPRERKPKATDFGQYRAALAAIPQHISTIGDLNRDAASSWDDATACANAAEQVGQIRAILGEYVKTLGHAYRMVEARSIELAKSQTSM